MKNKAIIFSILLSALLSACGGDKNNKESSPEADADLILKGVCHVMAPAAQDKCKDTISIANIQYVETKEDENGIDKRVTYDIIGYEKLNVSDKRIKRYTQGLLRYSNTYKEWAFTTTSLR